MQAADTNQSVWVEASYTDGQGHSEQPSSTSLFIKPLFTDGELTATLMVIEGPDVSHVHTPITTLLLRAVELGETPNGALQKIRTALNVPAEVPSLLSMNAFQILQSGVGDTATALKLARLEVQVAVLCSVSDDQDGLKLTLALLEQGANDASFDLTDPADVAAILATAPIYATAFSSGSTVSSLGSQYISLTLTGASAINGTGNSNNNILNGNSANNLLNGGLGGDTMAGGAGNDTYLVDSIADRISEAANGGTDLVQATINFSLTDYAAVENLTLTGSSATTASGNGLNNIITGNSAANTITSLEGNDTLAGGQGNDTLTGGSGSDLFRFDTTPGNANRDLITDFSSGSDKLFFSKTVYAGFSSSATTITSTQLLSGAGVSAATTSAQRFLYDSSAGILRFDRDGTGSTYTALEVAQLGASTFLAATDFILG